MTQDDIIRMAREADVWVAGQEPYQTQLNRFAQAAYAAGAAAERKACEALQQHEDVLAPVGNSAWGEAYQEGWAEGTAAYRDAIRARGEVK